MHGRRLAFVLLVTAASLGAWLVLRPAGAAPCLAVDLEGRTVRPLASQDSGVTVLLFLTPDCPISNRYAPTIRALRERYFRRGVSFWLVYPDADVSAAELQQHLLAYELSDIPAVRDPEYDLVDAARATTVPEAAVFAHFDRRHQLVYHGRIDDRYVDFGIARSQPTTHDLDQAILAALEGSPPKSLFRRPIGCPIPRSSGPLSSGDS